MAEEKIVWPVDIRFEREDPHVSVGTTGHVDYGNTQEMVLAEALLTAKGRIEELEKLSHLKSVLLARKGERIEKLEKLGEMHQVLIANKQKRIKRLEADHRRHKEIYHNQRQTIGHQVDRIDELEKSKRG